MIKSPWFCLAEFTENSWMSELRCNYIGAKAKEKATLLNVKQPTRKPFQARSLSLSHQSNGTLVGIVLNKTCWSQNYNVYYLYVSVRRILPFIPGQRSSRCCGRAYVVASISSRKHSISTNTAEHSRYCTLSMLNSAEHSRYHNPLHVKHCRTLQVLYHLHVKHCRTFKVPHPLPCKTLQNIPGTAPSPC